MPHMKGYRCNAIIAAGKCSTPISEIIELGETWVNDYAGCTLGNPTDLPNAFAKPVWDSLNERISSILCGGGCFNEFSVTFDGTPSFAEAEAIVIRCVTKTWKVIEILVKCSLFKIS